MVIAVLIVTFLFGANSYCTEVPAEGLNAPVCKNGQGQLPEEACVNRLSDIAGSIAKQPQTVPKAFSCPEYDRNNSKRKDISLYQYSPDPETIKGNQFPKNGQTLYRGIRTGNPQYSLTQAASAMLGDQNSVLGSYTYDEIRKDLLGEQPLEKSDIWNHIQSNTLVLTLVKQLKNCGPMNRQEAALYARDVMDRSFEDLQSKNLVEPMYLDPRSDSFQKMPREAFYGSVYQNVAGWYGKTTVVYEEAKPRSLDLNYWQYKKIGRSFEGQSSWDVGEFISMGYVPGSDIKGFWIKSYDTVHPNTADIQWAFQKVKVNGIPYIIVIDGNQTHCIERSQDRFYPCELNYPNNNQAEIKPYPIINKEHELPVVAVIQLCKEDKKCDYPSAVFDKYRLESKKSLPDDIMKDLKKIADKKGHASIFVRNNVKPIAEAKQIKIVSANYTKAKPPETTDATKDTDITSSIMHFCENYAECSFPNDGIVKVQYRCGQDDKVRTQTVDNKNKLSNLNCEGIT